MTARLNKFISDCGISSRRKSEQLILQGRVAVNNKIVADLSFKVDPEHDVVEVDGEKIIPRRHVYFLLNKPKGFITSTSDEKSRRTVVDLIKTKEKIFPVGRLDYNTTGVLLVTNDGDFANLLIHPKHRVPREYEVRLDRGLEDEDRTKLLNGIYIGGKKGWFTGLQFPKKKDRKTAVITAEEGTNHFVKDMFKALSYNVTALNRKSFAGIKADIPVGSYRPLSADEISKVIKTYVK